MNPHRIFVSIFVSLALLAIPSALLSYDSSTSSGIVIPECIWAPATGGGTWVTQLQITAVTAGVVVGCQFYYSGGGYRQVLNLWTSPGYNSCARFSNILSTLQSRDPSFTYYGKVGTLVLFSSAGRFHSQARTINGNYGKTLPGLPFLQDGNSAAVGRDIMIQDLAQSATYRTFVGVFSAAQVTMNVMFVIYKADGTMLGTFSKNILTTSRFMSFNPFVEAGLGSGAYENCWLYIHPTTGPSSGQGLFGFGSLANNYTNDSSALMAVQYQ